MAPMIIECLHSRRQLLLLEEGARGPSLWPQEGPRAPFLFWNGSVWGLSSVLRHFLCVSMLVLLCPGNGCRCVVDSVRMDLGGVMEEDHS
jgi:hypothetical protein